MNDTEHATVQPRPALSPLLADYQRRAMAILGSADATDHERDLATALITVVRIYAEDIANRERVETAIHQRWAADYHNLKARLVKLEALFEPHEVAAALQKEA